MILEKKFILIITALVIFALGVLLGTTTISLNSLNVDNKITYGEITNIFTNLVLVLFVAIYVPFFLNKKISNKRIEKDILIESCNQLRSELYELREMVETSHIGGTAVKKDLADRIIFRTGFISNLLNQIVEECKVLYKNDKKIKQLLEELISNNNDYRADLTLNLRGNRRKITLDSYRNSENQLKKYLTNLSKLKLLVNDA